MTLSFEELELILRSAVDKMRNIKDVPQLMIRNKEND